MMSHDRDLQHDQQPESESASHDDVAPGRANRTAHLKRADITAPSGILMRKGGGSVAAHADDAVARAGTSSSGGALPDDLRTKFEGSLGVDLSGVRVHTGSESAAAASAVGAHAYATGNDIHFAAGAYDPGSERGQHLIAHEVAHTVQQRGAPTTRQHKLAVSSAGDSAEVEADRAADAMIAGKPAMLASSAASGILHRKGADTPSNSYNRGELKWENGTALTEEEHQAFASKCASSYSAAKMLFMRAAGWQGMGKGTVVAKLVAQCEEQYDARIGLCEAEIAHFESQIEGLEDKGSKRTPDEEKRLAEYRKRLVQSEGDLERLEQNKDPAMARLERQATSVVATVNDFAGKANQVAGAINSHTQTLKPDIFKDIGDASSKIDNAIKVTHLAGDLLDRSSFNAFQANPSFETAAAWGRQVGSIFKGASGFVQGLPLGWDDVIQGVMEMPAIVIDRFTAVVRAYYARVDAETRDPQAGKGRLLNPGESG